MSWSSSSSSLEEKEGDYYYNAADNSIPPWWISMVAGCIAGAIETTATWPFEYVKTKIQLQQQQQQQQQQEQKRSLASSCHHDEIILPPATTTECRDGLERIDDLAVPPDDDYLLLPYTNMVSGLLYTIRTTGFWSLYYGLLPTLLGSIPKAGIRFGMFVWFSNLLRNSSTGDLSIFNCFLAGLAAGCFEALFVVVPVETIKTKCIYMKLPFWQCVRTILRLEGPRGFFGGVLPTCLKQSSNHGMRFVCYYEYKRLVSHNGTYELTLWQSFLGGMLAGVVSAVGNQPFDTLKTRMQGFRARELYRNTWDCIQQTFGNEGVAGFYLGIVPRLARVVPGQGIIFMSFESIVILLVGLSSSQ